MRFILTALLLAIMAGCTTHLALLTLDRELDNQEQYIDEYNAKINGEISNGH